MLLTINRVIFNPLKIFDAAIDSLLCDTNTMLFTINYDVEKENHKYHAFISLKVVDEVMLFFKNKCYKKADDYPKELVNIIKNHSIDKSVDIWAKNTIDIFGTDVIKTSNKINIDKSFSTPSDVFELLINELKNIYNISEKSIAVNPELLFKVL